jgi:hypothetical protein
MCEILEILQPYFAQPKNHLQGMIEGIFLCLPVIDTLP